MGQSNFLEKLVSKMNRLDSESLQTQFLNLVHERGLLETIFQAIQEGVIVVASDSSIYYANRAAETMLGFEFSRMRGHPIARYMPDVEWDKLARMDEDEWTKLSRSEIEVFYPVHRILSMYAVPMDEDLADGPCVVAILRDVTREREDEAEFVETERMRAVRILAASIAHEIGNPLNALGIHLQLLGREVSGLPEGERERLGELVDIARGEVSRLDLIISKFLRALRPSNPDLVPCDITEVLSESLQVMKSDIEEHRIKVSVKQSSSIPKVMADAQQMKQVFFNVIKNAIQAMHDSGTLEISISADDRDLTISFRDSGSGMTEDGLRKMFEPFATSKAKGNGLGLAIVDRIVRDHGGRIDVSSRSGAGTVFSVVLPLANRRARMLAPTDRDRARGDSHGDWSLQ